MKRNNKNKRPGNVYDRIFKENAESLFITLIEQELNFKIKTLCVANLSKTPDFKVL